MDIILTGIRFRDKRIQAIKELRALTGMGLRDSKDAVDTAMGFFEPAEPVSLTVPDNANLAALDHLIVQTFTARTAPGESMVPRDVCVEFALLVAAIHPTIFDSPAGQAFLAAARA